MGSRRRDRRNGDRARRTRLAADHQIRSRNACASVRGIPGLCVSRSSSRLLISAFTRHPPTPLIAPSLRHHQRFFCGRFGVRGCSLSSTSISETYSKEISTRTGLARSTTHRLVSELVQWGAITRGDESGDEYMYRVGPLECSALRRRQLVMHRGNQAESGGSGSTPPLATTLPGRVLAGQASTSRPRSGTRRRRVQRQTSPLSRSATTRRRRARRRAAGRAHCLTVRKTAEHGLIGLDAEVPLQRAIEDNLGPHAPAARHRAVATTTSTVVTPAAAGCRGGHGARRTVDDDKRLREPGFGEHLARGGKQRAEGAVRPQCVEIDQAGGRECLGHRPRRVVGVVRPASRVSDHSGQPVPVEREGRAVERLPCSHTGRAGPARRGAARCVSAGSATCPATPAHRALGGGGARRDGPALHQ